MRLILSSALAVMLLTGAGPAISANAGTTRERIQIPAQSLGPAIRTLAREREFQVVYVSGQVEHRRTPGASGDLTTNEALTQVLRGTGLTFYRTTNGGVVIEPVANRAIPASSRSPKGTAAGSVSPPAGQFVHAAPGELEPVMIEGRKERRALQRKVRQFMVSVLALTGNDTNLRWNRVPDRWNVPLCPLVAGLPKATGDLTLVRIFNTATQARVRLAGKVCHPNLYVLASRHPARLLKKWWARYPRMYVTKFGILPVERWIASRRPIRVWYNTGLWCGSFTPVGWKSFAKQPDGSGPLGFDLPVCRGPGPIPTYGHPWSNITAAFVVIDLRRIKNVTARQLADYVSLVGLAGIRVNANPGPVPSILQLFGPGAPAQGMSAWDRALLYALYNTSPWAPMQTREIQLRMAKRLLQERVTGASEAPTFPD